MTTRGTKSAEPRCWWCHVLIPFDAPNRGTAPEMELPQGSGVVVCSPACPDRPGDAIVYVHPPWQLKGVMA